MPWEPRATPPTWRGALRQRDIAVFFSEEQALAGQPLTASLRKGLHKAKILVVIANRGMLWEPRWVRTEVEE